MLVGPGCGRQSAAPTPAVQAPAPEPEPAGPSEVELYEPKVTFRDSDIVNMEVKYRYTKGGPHRRHFYNLEIRFPGSPGRGVMTLFGTNLSPSGGTIKDGFSYKPGAKSFEIFLSEAEARPGPYKTISNVVSGTIQD
jgi:hypothetical protein